MTYISKRVKRNKLILLLCLVIMIFLSIFCIKDTYAKYITTTTGDADISVARWKILVNNKDITSEKEISNVISPVFAGNDDIAPSVIAPTAEGYFDLIIDASDTDVSLKYEITTSDNKDSVVRDLVISGYSLNVGDRQDINNSNNQFKIEGTILYNSTNKKIKLRVHLKWNDDEGNGASMDNKEDTKAARVTGGLAKVNVNLKFTQLPNTSN